MHTQPDNSDVAIAERILHENLYLTLATASSDAEPWVSPVLFARDDEHTFYWVSYKESHHSTLIRQNNATAFVVFDSQVDEGEGNAVYVKATTTELQDPQQIERGIEALDARVSKDSFRVNDVSAVTGDAAWRMYAARPEKVWILDRGKEVSGQHIVTRKQVELT
jgi:nitroimidazol reductase NimA-like FMN-containing flavoprotein (pyridoxamine 5'-phosphate oxidase superfamily)